MEVRPDVITIDLEMPVMDGVEAMRAIMETIAAAPHRHRSVSGSRGGLEAASAAGAAASLSKEKAVGELVPTIHRLVTG